MNGSGGPEVLEARDCWRLLRTASLGRLAVVARDAEGPDIFPINFRSRETDIFFRTAPGSNLSAVMDGAMVALEADDVASATGWAWSVVAKGRAAELSDADETARAADKLLFPWEPGAKEHLVRIEVETITGRRFKIQPPDDSGLSFDDAIRAGLE